MANDLQSGSEPSAGSLLSGIVSDFQTLITQQLSMFKAEVEEDAAKTRAAAISLAVGAVVSLLGGIVLLFGLVYLLHDLTRPEGQPNATPYWYWFAVVGGIVSGIGVALALSAKKQFESFNPLPDKTVAAIAENLSGKH